MFNKEFLEHLKGFFVESNLNRLHKNYGEVPIFSSPIMGVANGDDIIFQKFNEVVGPEHLTPSQMWQACGEKLISQSELRVISIVFPFSEEIRKESSDIVKPSKVTLPAETYSVGRNYSEAFKAETLRQAIKFFIKKGYRAVAPMLSKVYSIILKNRFYSTWSERHIAFAAGLGTFSLHEGLITNVGCNIRLASLITDTPFKITLRKTENPYGNCLYYNEGICRECEKRCPAKAITKEGHDKIKCSEHVHRVERKMIAKIRPILKAHRRQINGLLRPPCYPVGCAFCQFQVPCMDKNPVIQK